MARTTSAAHAAFEIGIFLKALNGAAEIVAGVLLYVVPANAITHTLERLTQHQLSKDRSDFIATHLLRFTEHFSTGSKIFAAAYLLSHGIVKVVLVWALFRKKLWAYPAAIAVFAAFGVYQMYRYSVSRSVAMIALTVLDVLVIVLTWIEYRRLKQESVPHLRFKKS